jgi:hypothetical protein
MERTRATGFRSLANAIFVIEKYNATGQSGNELKNAGTLQQLERWLDALDEVPQEQQHHIHEVFDTFLAMANNKDPSVKDVFKTRVAPVEFIFISLLLSVLLREKAMGTDQLKFIAEKVSDMRMDVRKRHVDIRANTRVEGVLMEFVRAISGRRGWNEKGDGMGSGVKRKRVEAEGEEEEEEGGHMAKKPNTATRTLEKATTSASTPTPTSSFPRTRLAPVPTPSNATATVMLPDQLATITANVPGAASRYTPQGSVMRTPAI